MLRGSCTQRDSDVGPGSAPAQPYTQVDVTRIEGRIEQWVRFGRVAATESTGRGTSVFSFRPGATFALVRRISNDFGTTHASIAIVTAAQGGRPFVTLPFIRPGGDLLLRLNGWPQVQQARAAIDAVEAAGLDACDVSPDHWRHVGEHIAAGMVFRPYGADRHAAWLRRRAIEA